MSQTAVLNENHSHSQIVRRVPRYAQVLELGCGVGSMSQLLKAQCEAHIIGFDIDANKAWQAERYCDYVFSENLDDPHSLDALEGEKFDVVTLVDVIEHLQQPLSLLKRLQTLLLDEGCLLLSVPNIAHASVRLELLNGGFNYEDAGILDETHLRFFTLDTLQTLLQQAGYSVTEVDYTWHDLPDEVIAHYLESAGIQATPDALAKFHEPDAMAYQFIIKAEPKVVREEYPFTLQQLKPINASWNTWGKLYAELQAADLNNSSLDKALHAQQEQMAHLQRDVQLLKRELAEVYATRSWQMLRKGAEAWRTIQSRFTHP